MEIIAKPNSTTSNKTGNWRTFVPKTDYNKCTGCGTCSRVCPENAITMVKNDGAKKTKPQTDLDFCKGCGLCAIECPAKAITMELDKK